jgi:hypothetical protein
VLWDAEPQFDTLERRSESMPRYMRTLLILSIMAVMLGILAPAAFASGSFTWTGQFTHRLVSRQWSTPNTGTHRINTNANSSCPGPGNIYRLRLVRDRTFGDYFYGWQNNTCGYAGSHSWTAGSSGTFHFDAEKADTTDTYWAWTISGTTYYP